MEFENNNSNGVYDHSVNPDSVEAIIDACRLSCDWEGVLSGIKKYGQIFDAGAASSSYQHANIDAVRAYYWVCKGEALYELKGDYYNAIDCAKRAIAIDPSCVEARIIVTRVLLDNCGSALRIHRKKHRESNPVAGEMTVDLDARSILSELLKVTNCCEGSCGMHSQY